MSDGWRPCLDLLGSEQHRETSVTDPSPPSTPACHCAGQEMTSQANLRRMRVQLEIVGRLSLLAMCQCVEYAFHIDLPPHEQIEPGKSKYQKLG